MGAGEGVRKDRGDQAASPLPPRSWHRTTFPLASISREPIHLTAGQQEAANPVVVEVRELRGAQGDRVGAGSITRGLRVAEQAF